jgi:hypothetical protein
MLPFLIKIKLNRANFTSAVCGIELNHMDDPVPDGLFTMGAVDESAYVLLRETLGVHILEPVLLDFPETSPT